jgi:hypothetical protein
MAASSWLSTFCLRVFSKVHYEGNAPQTIGKWVVYLDSGKIALNPK